MTASHDLRLRDPLSDPDNGALPRRWRAPARLGRRRFLCGLGGIPVAGPVLFHPTLPTFAQDPQGLLAAMGKHPRMIVHDAVTGVAETPIDLLRGHRVTPKELLFVRNNQVLPGGLTLNPYPSGSWDLEVGGLVTPPRTVRFSDLARLEQAETVAVLQCAGNGRAFYARSAMTKGTQWQRGGMGQIRWKGVRLRQFLDSFGMHLDAKARFLTAEGRDSPASPAGDDYEQSVPLADVLETALIATHMNGEPIPAVHGGPLRLVLPGYYGSMNVKWLSRLRFEDRASMSRHHAQRYRTFRHRVVPGTAPDVIPETTNPTWRQRIKSVIWNPLHHQRVRRGPITISGVAWNDGRTEIVAIELSLDGGRTWQRVDFDAPFGRYGWHPWKAVLWYGGNRNPSWRDPSTELRVRAFDAFGRSQPDDGSVHWNPSGYEWFGVDSVKVFVI